MENLIRDRIINLHKDFESLNTIGQAKNLEIQNFKKQAGLDFNLQENIQDFSDLVADFNLITRDLQIIFTELFNIIKLYKNLNLSELPVDVVEFYNKNELYFPKTIFVVKEEGIVEKEEGSVQKERDKFIKSDYLKNLINAKG